MTKFHISQRYTASEAMQHPWITRINKTTIPLTLPDRMNNIELEFKLRNKISLILFMSIIKREQEAKLITPKNKKHKSNNDHYKRLVSKFLNNIA